MWPSTHDNHVHFGSSTLYCQTIYGGTLYQSQSGTWLNKDVEKKSRLTDGLTRPSTLSVKGRWAPCGDWLRSMTDCKVVVSSLVCYLLTWPHSWADDTTQAHFLSTLSSHGLTPCVSCVTLSIAIASEQSVHSLH